MPIAVFLIVPFVLFGVLCAVVTRNRFGRYAAGLLPFIVVLIAVIFVIDDAALFGGADVAWPIGYVFGAIVASGISFFSFQVTRHFLHAPQR